MDIARDIRVVRFLPVYFSTISRLLGLLSQDEPSIPEIVQAVGADQSLVARLLCIVNSPAHGAVRQIASVDEAVVRIGLVGLRNITLAVAMADVTGGVKWKEWFHSLTVAHVADLYARKWKSSREVYRFAYVSGLMHDIGKLFLTRRYMIEYQEVYKKVSNGWALNAAEKSIFGYDHAAVGAMLLSVWSVPPLIVEAIYQHHEPGQSSLATVLNIAHQIIDWNQQPADKKYVLALPDVSQSDLERIFSESVIKAREMEALFR